MSTKKSKNTKKKKRPAAKKALVSAVSGPYPAAPVPALMTPKGKVLAVLDLLKILKADGTIQGFVLAVDMPESVGFFVATNAKFMTDTAVRLVAETYGVKSESLHL